MNKSNDGKRTMIWVTPEQKKNIDLLKSIEPGISVSKLVRDALTLYLRAQRVRRSL